MSKYAIVKFGPFQYKVEEGKEYTVQKINAEAGKKLADFEVLALGSDSKFEVGMPTLDSKLVEIEVVEQGKGEKIQSRIFKAKSRYRRTRGIRKQVTKFKVVSIKF